MRAYRTRTEGVLRPFGDPPRACLVANKALATLQTDALREAGITDVLDVQEPPAFERDEHLILPDNYYVTAKLLREFTARSRDAGTHTNCGIALGPLLKTTSLNTQSVRRYENHVEYALQYRPRGAASRLAPRVVVIDPPYRVIPVRVPAHIGGSSAPLVISSEHVVISVNHWANLLCANVSELWSRYARLRSLPKRELASLLLRHALRRRRKADGASTIGRNCIIHPSAVIEGSVIGDGAIIGPNTVVQLSTIGENAQVGAGAVIEASVVGDRAFVSSGAVVSRSVLYPSAVTNARFMHASILGRESFAAGQVAFSDFRFDGKTAHVAVDGRLVDTELRLLGVCVGHRTYLGSGVVLSPGRTLPNDRRVLVAEGRASGEGDGTGAPSGYRMFSPDELMDLASRRAGRLEDGENDVRRP